MTDSAGITHQQILDKIDTGNKRLLAALTQQLGKITDNMATKDDVREIVRSELNSYATKNDLERATVRLERQITSSRATNVKHHLETRKALGDLNKELSDMREAW